MGGSTGQVLKKVSNTNYDYSWQADETGAGGSLSLTEVEVDLGTAARPSGRFTISGTGMTIGKHVLIQQANGPYTGKGTLSDEAEMDALVVSAKVTSATVIECFWKCLTGRARGNFKFAYAVG